MFGKSAKWLWAALLPALLFSQTPKFSADSTFAYIKHLSENIGPRPVGSTSEQTALAWAMEKFRQFQTDESFIIPFHKAESRDGDFNTKSGTAVGIFRGKSDTIIVVGGHVDSDSRVFPGANDNASGAASTLELARIWSQRDRRYTMVFAIFGGEERGLLGSQAFVEKFTDIDKAALMFCIDMTGGDENIMTLAETDSMQSPKWLMKDAFRIDRDLGINRLQYPTHFATINNLGEGAGSDHIPFLEKKIPSIDFTVGVNRFPIHSPQDKLRFINMDMLDNCGRLIDGLILKYQTDGIPKTETKRFIFWKPLGIMLFIPPWILTGITVTAFLIAIGAYLKSRKDRPFIEKHKRIRFSGWKLFFILIILALFSRFGGVLMGLVKGWRHPWVVHVIPHLWYTVIWVLAGLWVVLQLTKKWRFSPDPHIYAFRALLILMILLIPAALLDFRLAVYPALSLLLFSLAILIRKDIVKIILTLLAPWPMFRLMFSEAFEFTARFSRFVGFQFDSFGISLLYFIGVTLLLILWYLPFIYMAAYNFIQVKWIRALLKNFSKPGYGILILAGILVYGGILTALPSYNEMWKPQIQVRAHFDSSEQESRIALKGDDFLKTASVKVDTVNKTYGPMTYKDDIHVSFSADWIKVTGLETITKGEKDTIDIRWTLKGNRPWYLVRMTLETDTLKIDTVITDLMFTQRKKECRFVWQYDPPQTIPVQTRIVKPPEARLIRNVVTYFSELPLPVEVISDWAHISCSTRVTMTDTLNLGE